MTEHAEAQKPSTMNGEAKTATQVTRGDLVAKVATVAVVGVGAALISVELIPGLLIGAAAALLPNFMPKLGKSLRPAMRSTVRASYKLAQKTRETFAEAGEQMQDMVAEARLEHTEAQAGAGAVEGVVQ
jgi:hypothetical protein